MRFFVLPRSSFRLFALAALVSGVVLAGCSAPPPTKSPQEMIKTGYRNTVFADSGAFEVRLRTDLSGTDPEKKVQHAVATVTLTGDGSFKDQALAANLTANVSMKSDDSLYAGEADAHLTKEALFVTLSKLVDSQKTFSDEQLAKFMGKTWRIPLPPDVASSYAGAAQQYRGFFNEQPATAAAAVSPASVVDIASVVGKKSTVAGKAAVAPVVAPVAQNTGGLARGIHEMFTNGAYLTGLQYEGSERVKGEPSYHYSAAVDRAQIRAFFDTMAKESGRTLNDADVKNLQDIVDKLTVRIHMWVTAKGEMLTKVLIDGSIDTFTAADGASQGSGTVSLEILSYDFGKTVTVQAPSPSEDFDLFSLLGGLGSLGGADGMPIDGVGGDTTGGVSGGGLPSTEAIK